jgi:uncharacterized protein
MNGVVFPNFKKITLEDKNEIENFTKKFSPYSDFNFISLWSYDTHNDVVYSWLNGNFVMRFRDYLTKDYFLTFLGNAKPKETIISLLEYSKNNNILDKLELIPEDNIKELLISEQTDLIITEDIDQHDYIIPLKETIDLSNINPHKQKSYYKFLDDYKFEVKELDLSDEKIQIEMLDLFEIWKLQKGEKADEANNEFLAMKKLFDHAKSFSLFSLGIYINQKLICYIIDERLQEPFVIGHFLKADLSFKGVYEVMNKISAEMHYQKGYKYINIEQDLGIEGLRISKKQRNPAFYLKKYIISYK